MFAKQSSRTLLRPMMGAMTSMTPGAFFTRQRRHYHDFRIAMFNRYPKTIFTAQDGVDAIDDIFHFAHKTELLVGQMGQLTVLTLPEFWANRSTAIQYRQHAEDVDQDIEIYNAAQPLPLETFKAIAERVRTLFSKMPGGYLFVLGGVAVDTGFVLPSGKILGTNYGLVVESGLTADCVIYNKVHHDPIDGWDTDRYTPGPGDGHIGPLTKKIVDPSGGKARIYTVITCADMDLGPFPKDMSTSHLVLASTYGTPPNWQSIWANDEHISEYATVAVNDSSLNDLNLGSGPGGILQYRRAPKHPWLADFHAVASWAGFGDFALAAYQAVLGVSPTDALATELGFQKVATAVRQSDGLKVVVTEPRPFGPELQEAEEEPKEKDDITDK